MESLDYKCPQCLATLRFNPNNQKWDCEYCHSSFAVDELSINDDKFKNKQIKDNIILDTYTCKNCGASLITDENTSATFCVYCKSTAIIKERLIGNYQPDMIIPFYKTKEDAINAFKSLTKRKIFTQDIFRNINNIEEIRGVYIPFWLFDIECSGSVSGTAKKIETWQKNGYTHVKTDYYDIERTGESFFENIPVDASSNFDDSIMNSIEPFNYNELKEFNYGYLSGFYSENYGLTKEEVYSIALDRANSSFTSYLKNDIDGYSSTKITNKNINNNLANAKYVLLPVWMLNIRYKNQIRTFAMNGQTGKIIGNIPIDKTKLIVFSLILFIIIFIIIMMCFYAMGWSFV